MAEQGTRVNIDRLKTDRVQLCELKRLLEWYVAWHTTPNTDEAARRILRTVGRKLTYNKRAMQDYLPQWNGVDTP